MSFVDDDGDEDMAALMPAPDQLALVPDGQQQKEPRGRARGCGVCRSCLFNRSKGCLANKTQAQVEEATQRHNESRQVEVRARKRERALGAAAPVPGAATGGERGCRLCARGTHGANKCPLRTVLEACCDAAGETDDRRWAEALDDPMRQVLLAVQQLASAQAQVQNSRRGRKAMHPAPVHSLSAQQLRAIQDILTRDSLQRM